MVSLRIGVDARPLCHPGTGIYRYTFELLSRMCRMGGEWFLYSSQAYGTAAFDNSTVQHRIAGIPRRLRAAQSAHLFFPLWSKRDGLDVFWGPRHQLPLWLPAGVRSIVTIHDMVWRAYGDTMRFPGRQIEAFFMPRALKKADRVAAVSEFTRAEIAGFYPGHLDKISVVTGAGLLSAGDKQQRQSTRAGDYFLFVGTQEPRKNLPRLLRAYAHYVERNTRARLLKIVGGSGWGGQNLPLLLRELGIDGQVEILTGADDAQLAEMYRGAHALVMPSLYEGFGLPVVEALSLGVPVITSRESAMSEVAGTAALLVDPMSETDITKALHRISDDSQLYRELKTNAPLESRRYDWDRSAAKMYRMITARTGDQMRISDTLP
jgi:glycosyltransferase involved in cell wall biosynthesis